MFCRATMPHSRQAAFGYLESCEQPSLNVWRHRNLAVSHEVLQGTPQVGDPRKALSGNLHCPLITISFPIEVKVRTADLLVIRISMRGATKIKSHQNDN